ncbi:MAG: hypothetical protein KJ950_13440 [Proteobacteria bacterium]|nr:hypothetical protein [Pseudomonadota bacterium]MBU1687445.1 hypothetical protein [Pseudomonadota bacterium]
MKKLLSCMCCWLVLATFLPSPAVAEFDEDFEAVEKGLLKKQPENQLPPSFLKEELPPPVAQNAKKDDGGSNWLRWTLGVLAVGGVAAAAGGGGGGGGGGGSSNSGTTSMSVSW